MDADAGQAGPPAQQWQPAHHGGGALRAPQAGADSRVFPAVTDRRYSLASSLSELEDRLVPLNLIEVSAGLVFREGKLLITQRPEGGHLAGLWEFPGGKREPGETFEECLERELHEELGIEVEVGQRVESLTHHYPEQAVRLEFFFCRWLQHEPRAIGCPAFAWVTREELAGYKFPAADARLIGRLVSERQWWESERDA